MHGNKELPSVEHDQNLWLAWLQAKHDKDWAIKESEPLPRPRPQPRIPSPDRMPKRRDGDEPTP
jgi:hypothetical protein